MIKIDPTATTVTIDPRGLVCIDGIPMFKMAQCDGEWWLIVKDRNIERSCVRRTDLVRVPLDVLVAKLMKEDERKGRIK